MPGTELKNCVLFISETMDPLGLIEVSDEMLTRRQSWEIVYIPDVSFSATGRKKEAVAHYHIRIWQEKFKRHSSVGHEITIKMLFVGLKDVERLCEGAFYEGDRNEIIANLVSEVKSAVHGMPRG